MLLLSINNCLTNTLVSTLSFSICTVHFKTSARWGSDSHWWFTHSSTPPLPSTIFNSVYEPLIPVICHQKFRVRVGLKEILAGQWSVKRLIQKRAQVRWAHSGSTPWHSGDLNVTTYVYSQLLHSESLFEYRMINTTCTCAYMYMMKFNEFFSVGRSLRVKSFLSY